MLAAILDWRDADDLKRPNGAEEPDYRAAGKTYKPANAPFDSVGELQRVLGVTPALVARIADSLTVYSRQPGINPATASRDVLLAIPNVTPEAVDAYIALRDDALANKLPVPPFPQAQGFAIGRGARLAHPCRGDDARWCNLRPRRGAAPVGRPAAAGHRPAVAGGRAHAAASPRMPIGAPTATR